MTNGEFNLEVQRFRSEGTQGKHDPVGRQMQNRERSDRVALTRSYRDDPKRTQNRLQPNSIFQVRDQHR
jgi:hypothetical protein